ncbi:MAG: hypothetical protein SGPRY_014043 [Prymnesium sp.]
MVYRLSRKNALAGAECGALGLYLMTPERDECHWMDGQSLVVCNLTMRPALWPSFVQAKKLEKPRDVFKLGLSALKKGGKGDEHTEAEGVDVGALKEQLRAEMEAEMALEKQQANEEIAELKADLQRARENPEAKEWEQLSQQLMATREEREAAHEQLSTYTQQLMEVKMSEALLREELSALKEGMLHRAAEGEEYKGGEDERRNSSKGKRSMNIKGFREKMMDAAESKMKQLQKPKDTHLMMQTHPPPPPPPPPS